ncbi:hypothetical protein AX15_006391 [Amanita polypyramis BW_CC]|nr:hypothetical protein AX15_006391 [Amanita polypyramis BW_CC]
MRTFTRGMGLNLQNEDVLTSSWNRYSPTSVPGTPITRVVELARLTVIDGSTELPIKGATATGRTSDANGHAFVTFFTPGIRTLKAEKSDFNAFTIYVYQ